MIISRLNGGLGNQLFQYATGRILAMKLNVDLYLDASAFNNRYFTANSRNLELNNFNHIGKIFKNRALKFLPSLRILEPLSRHLTPWTIFFERGRAYDPDVLKLQDQSYLVGYWQSYRYFSQISYQLKTEFEPVNQLSPKSRSIQKKIDTSNSIALHIRRGDYVSLPSAANFHGTLSLSYYDAAIARIRECVVEPKFFVFSDDPAWCRENLRIGNSAIIVDHNGGVNSWEDLLLMGRCRHHVIANSSFSWWGAWLADQRFGIANRIVCAPLKWFATQPISSVDRFPVHWTVC